MKRKPKHTSKQYQFLEEKGVLTNGTDAEIQATKKEYRRIYQTAWRKQKREVNQEITVSYDTQQLHIIAIAAKKHRRTLPQYVKEAALAYTVKTFVVPDTLAVNSILEYLVMTYTQVQKLFDENRLPFQTSKEALQMICDLETAILKSLHQPQNLEELITTEIRKNPAYRETLYQLLQKPSV